MHLGELHRGSNSQTRERMQNKMGGRPEARLGELHVEVEQQAEAEVKK